MDLVVGGFPLFDLLFCIFKVKEKMLVKTLVPKPRIETFNERVLVWFPRRDEFVSDLLFFEPREQRR